MTSQTAPLVVSASWPLSVAGLLAHLELDETSDNLLRCKAAVGEATKLVGKHLRRSDGFESPPVNESRMFGTPPEGCGTASKWLLVDDFQTARPAVVCYKTKQWKVGDLRVIPNPADPENNPPVEKRDWSDGIFMLEANGREWKEMADADGLITVSATWGWDDGEPAEVKSVLRKVAVRIMCGEKLWRLHLSDDEKDTLLPYRSTVLQWGTAHEPRFANSSV